MSAFAIASHGALVCRATRLTAGPNPRLSSEATTVAHGNSVWAISALPSVDALSTTHTSARPAETSGSIVASAARSSSLVFHEMTAIVTAGVGDGTSGTLSGRSSNVPAVA